MTVHVLGHTLEAAVLSWRELRDSRAARRRWRAVAIAGSLVVGVGLASALLPAGHGWVSHSADRHEQRDR